jgi:hypothetical protein
MKSGGSLSIWFFIGISLAVVVLYNLHANIWWGGLLLVLGVFFSLRFSPVRERARMAGTS